MKFPIRRSIATGLAALAAAALLAGCSSDPAAPASTYASDGPTMPAAMTTVQVAINPTNQFASMYYGIQQGIFAKHNLTLNIVPQTDIAQTVAGLASGTYQFGQTTPIHVVAAAVNGIDIKEVSTVEGRLGQNDQGTSVVAGANSNITDLKGLSGKKVATVGLTSNNTYAADAIIDQAGGDWKSIQYVQIPFGQMQAALENGNVDAAIMQQPFAGQAVGNGAKIIGYTNSIYADKAVTVFDASADYINQHPEIVKAFSDAMIESIQAANENETAASDSLISALNYTQQQAEGAVRNKGGVPYLNTGGLETAQQLMQKYAGQTETIDVNTLIWPGALAYPEASATATSTPTGN
ncbi:ABC transporter substrate-binding protein [Subtercola sp. YIM 133946]|uniref:ABC transporter substrate-binding protein n=1 Tax=Subtercola sp. YIM 133946 TaxID=3118909 RepID=UPI002F9493A2